MSKISVFVSCPTILNEDQEKYNQMIDSLLDEFELERRALGRSDYALETPLKEIRNLASHCAGGIILGFEQAYIEKGIKKRGTKDEKELKGSIPTEWNNLEAGILYAMDLPLLIIKEKEISGGIFDYGSSEYFIHSFDSDVEIKQVFKRWVEKVHNKYDQNRY